MQGQDGVRAAEIDKCAQAGKDLKPLQIALRKSTVPNFMSH
eukprot:SAG11_NODE_1298_length_5265_cov_3.096787_5_plen_41_part_00